jgi:probable addiction module antidote protein
MKLSELKAFDAAKALKDNETIRHYLSLAFEGRDLRAIQRALGIVVRARDTSALARESGVAREALSRALSDTGNPEFATIVKVVGALGLHLTLTVHADANELAATYPFVFAHCRALRQSP